MNYTLVTGYYEPRSQAAIGVRKFRREWEDQILRSVDLAPSVLVTISVGDSDFVPRLGQNVRLAGNLGHVGDLLHGHKKHEFCGWSAAVLAGAMLAYCNETDFLYLEQDCLAFGPWVRKTYEDLGDGQFVFGRQMTSPPGMQCAQALFLVRHRWIPTFVKEYLSLGTDNDYNNLPENKFATIEYRHREQCRRLSFGCDRERPIPYDDPVFYAQKLTDEEMIELYRRGLLR